MKKPSFCFSNGFIEQFIKLTEGLLTSESFERVVNNLEVEASKFHFTNSSETNLLRIFSSVYDKYFFFLDMIKYSHHTEILIAISANSNYLTDIVVRNPEYLYQIFDPGYLSKETDEHEVETFIDEMLMKFTSFDTRLKFFRLIKKRVMLKIGVNDILRFTNLEQTTKQLSALAKIINAKLFELCYKETIKKYEINRPKQKYCLCSLGKLGGYELNYSSDVDLILFYDFNSSLPKIKKEYHELLSETAVLFIKSSSELTSNGYVFRVDFRLRPDGKYSTMCKSMNDYIKYYETRGEDWEKQMLIKLGYIGGDISLFHRFTNFTIPFIYQTSISSSIKDKIKVMKQNIERQFPQYDNIKTFKGGIRDIEFTLQALQLLHGGRIKSIRTGNSLLTILSLYNENLIKREEKDTLAAAYVFYRKVEHYLQLMNDLQTHVIPENLDMQLKIARYMGINSVIEFKRVLNSKRENVRRIYNAILNSEKLEKKVSKFININFQDPIKGEKDLNFLRTGTGILERKEFQSRTIELFSKIESVLIDCLVNSKNPDLVMENFAKVIRSTKLHSIWYQEFLDKNFFINFLNLCLFCQKGIDILISNPLYEEYYLTRRIFIKLNKKNVAELSVSELNLTLSVQIALKLIKPSYAAVLLSVFFEGRIKKMVTAMDLPPDYFMAALGSFSSQNMNFTSDIDLIIVINEFSNSFDWEKIFTSFLIKAKQEFKPFEIDFRLRPEGKNSPLVWDIKHYTQYLTSRARIWEFQSLLKLKFVSGNIILYKFFIRKIYERISKFTENELKIEIANMHSSIHKQIVAKNDGSVNLKRDKGGLQTIDFILQYFCLKNINLFKKSQGKTILKMFSILKDEFNQDHYNMVVENYNFLKHTEFILQNILNTSTSTISPNIHKRSLIADFLNYGSVEDFESFLKKVLMSNCDIYNKYLGD